jgi:hypothetical protein
MFDVDMEKKNKSLTENNPHIYWFLDLSEEEYCFHKYERITFDHQQNICRYFSGLLKRVKMKEN